MHRGVLLGLACPLPSGRGSAPWGWKKGFPVSSVQMQIRTVPRGHRVARSRCVAARAGLHRKAGERGKKSPKVGGRQVGDFPALSKRSTGRGHWCGPGGSRAPGASCSAGKQPRGPERQLPEPPGRLSAPAPPRRRVPGRGRLGDTPTSPARGGQCAGLLPRGPRSPRCHRDRGRVRRGARGTARLAPDSPSEARQESRLSAQAKAKHKGRRGGKRPERRGRRRGRCCAAANPETGRPAARRVQAVRGVPASLSPLGPCPRASPLSLIHI